MSLHYSDLLDIMMTRAERLGLVDPATQKVDAAELELYLFQALLDVVEVSDLEAYTVTNPQIAVTTATIASYPMPSDYGRLILMRVQNKRGIYLNDGLKNDDLTYVDPNSFARQTALVPGRPKQFTVSKRQIFLFPPPDTNTNTNYLIAGVYIERIDRPNLDDEVLLSYPTVLVDVALARLGSDMGKQQPALDRSWQMAMAKLTTKSGSTG